MKPESTWKGCVLFKTDEGMASWHLYEYLCIRLRWTELSESHSSIMKHVISLPECDHHKASEVRSLGFWQLRCGAVKLKHRTLASHDYHDYIIYYTFFNTSEDVAGFSAEMPNNQCYHSASSLKPCLIITLLISHGKHCCSSTKAWQLCRQHSNICLYEKMAELGTHGALWRFFSFWEDENLHFGWFWIWLEC